MPMARNALAFYTYPSDNPPATAKDIKNITYAFPNVGGTTTLQAGDKVNIGQFNPGTSIGFVIIDQCLGWTINFINNSSIHYCTNYVLKSRKGSWIKKACCID